MIDPLLLTYAIAGFVVCIGLGIAAKRYTNPILPGHCPSCGYDMSTSPSSIVLCNECGVDRFDKRLAIKQRMNFLAIRSGLIACTVFAGIGSVWLLRGATYTPEFYEKVWSKALSDEQIMNEIYSNRSMSHAATIAFEQRLSALGPSDAGDRERATRIASHLADILDDTKPSHRRSIWVKPITVRICQLIEHRAVDSDVAQSVLANFCDTNLYMYPVRDDAGFAEGSHEYQLTMTAYAPTPDTAIISRVTEIHRVQPDGTRIPWLAHTQEDGFEVRWHRGSRYFGAHSLVNSIFKDQTPKLPLQPGEVVLECTIHYRYYTNASLPRMPWRAMRLDLGGIDPIMQWEQTTEVRARIY